MEQFSGQELNMKDNYMFDKKDAVELAEKTLAIVDAAETAEEAQRAEQLAFAVGNVIDCYDIHPDLGQDLSLYSRLKHDSIKGSLEVREPSADPVGDFRKGLGEVLNSIK